MKSANGKWIAAVSEAALSAASMVGERHVGHRGHAVAEVQHPDVLPAPPRCRPTTV